MTSIRSVELVSLRTCLVFKLPPTLSSMKVGSGSPATKSPKQKMVSSFDGTNPLSLHPRSQPGRETQDCAMVFGYWPDTTLKSASRVAARAVLAAIKPMH